MSLAAPAHATILLTGATGFVGQHLLPALLQHGWQVRILTRRENDPRLTAWHNHPKVTFALGDLTQPETLPEAAQGCTHLVHAGALVSFRATDAEAMRIVNGLGTGHLVDAALAAGIQKLVYISSVAALGRPEHEAGLHTEDLKWTQSRKNTPYGYSKYLGEKQVARGVAEGLPAVILNPTIILGPGDWTQGTPRFFRMLDQGFRYYPKGVNGFVDVADVVQAVLLALVGGPAEAERIILCGDNWPYRDLMNAIADAIGRPRPGRPIPLPLAMTAAWLAERFSSLTGSEALITTQTLRTSAGISRYDNSRANTLLGLAFTPLHETVRRTAALYRQAFPLK